MKNHVLSLFLVLCVLMFSLSAHVSAVSVVENDEVAKASMSSGDDVVSPMGFVREYNAYMGSDSVEVMSDPNWDIFSDTSVTVTFKSTQGPSEVLVFIESRKNDEEAWYINTFDYLELGDTLTCNIQENYEFRVTASRTEGDYGNVTFQVSLS